MTPCSARSRAAATSAKSTRRRKARRSATMSALATWRAGSLQVRARTRCCTRSPSPSRRSTSPNGATSNAPHAPHLAAARVGTPGWFRAVCDDGRESRHVVPRDARRAQPAAAGAQGGADRVRPRLPGGDLRDVRHGDQRPPARAAAGHHDVSAAHAVVPGRRRAVDRAVAGTTACAADRSEEHTSELQSHLISYAVFCLKKKKNTYTRSV